MERKKRTCPGCGAELREVLARANYGRVLLLDQCRRCGGIWFDRWELYFLSPEEAVRLEHIDLPALSSRNPGSKGGGRCPVCSGVLKIFKDPALSPDLCIKKCPKCSGLWLNRGELTKYTAQRASFRGANKRTGPRPAPVTLKGLQKALDTSTVSNPESLSLQDTPPITPEEVAKDLAPVILRLLIRLIFKV